jgi:hypothetical protein
VPVIMKTVPERRQNGANVNDGTGNEIIRNTACSKNESNSEWVRAPQCVTRMNEAQTER